VAHPRLVEVLTDFDKLEKVAEYIKGDVWFSCLGTTLKPAGSREKQWHIDYDIHPHLLNSLNETTFTKVVLLSAYGASTSSRIFYSR
jgi:hypothetical protein